jgi:Endonuclease/Exonuclease/phosphatase family
MIVKLFTFNTFLIPVKPSFPLIDRDMYRRIDRVVELLGAIGEVDYICLQEVWGGVGSLGGYWLKNLFVNDRVIAALKIKGLEVANSPSGVSPDRGFKALDSGLVIASRKPIKKQYNHVYKKTSSGEDKFASKGVLCIYTDLLICTTHLDADSKTTEIKDAQLQELHGFVNSVKQEIKKEFKLTDDVKIIITGDFNLNGFIPQEYNVIASHIPSLRMKDAFIEAKSLTKPIFPEEIGTSPVPPLTMKLGSTSDGGGIKLEGQRLDYVWVPMDAQIEKFLVLNYHYWGIHESLLTEEPKDANWKKRVDKRRRLEMTSDHAGLIVECEIL